MTQDRHDHGDTQSGTANVVSLESGIRLTRANTKLSGFYTEKAARLSNLMQTRLVLLEGMLYHKSPMLRGCSKGYISKPEHRFECYCGTVDFFYSSDQNRFVLLDFFFNEGGGGGLPVQEHFERPGPTGSFAIAATSRAACWVALLKLACLPSAFSAVGACLTANLPRLLKATVDAQPRFGRGRHVVETGAAIRTTGLGAWAKGSILSDYVVTPVQLENHYARSILAGEAICDSAMRSSFGRAMLIQAKRRSCETSELFDESASALGVLFAGQASPSSRSSWLVVTHALGRSAVTDDRLLPIIRGELAAHLSVHVACSAASHWKEASPSAKRSYADTIVMMKKYSMLADLVALSLKAPKCEVAVKDANFLAEDYADALKNRLLIGAVAAFGTFDACIHTALADLGKGTAAEAEEVEMSALHRRALDLTRALLEPPNG